MKNTKKFAAMIAALTLSACSIAPMAMTASAEGEETYKITVGENYTGYTGDKATHTYEAYQIFTGTVIKDEKDLPTGKLEGIAWGSAINTDKVYEELAKITIGTGEEEKNPFKNGDSAMDSAAAVASALGSATDDSELAKKFADTIATCFKLDAKATEVSKTANIAGGYYLIQDKSASPDKRTDKNGAVIGAKTRYILKVVGDAEINPKSGVPSVEKKVVENVKESKDLYKNGVYKATDVKLNDVADYCIGDTVPFELIGTLPDAYDDYKSYFYQFNDTLGTQFDTPTKVNVKVFAVNSSGETDITSKFIVSDRLENTFTVTCNDLKKIDGITKDTVIVVRYDAVLNNTANIGLPGQENKVDLTYSRNPNYTGEGENTLEEDKGKTPEDKVIVFTYELDVTKYLDTKNTTAGTDKAGFKLYNYDSTKVATLDKNNKITGWTKITEENKATAGTEVKTTAYGTFNFIGLDDGTYTLVETTVPNGYNKMDDLSITINAVTANNQGWMGIPSDALIALKLNHGETLVYTANSDKQDTTGEGGNVTQKADKLGIVRDDIINKSGSTLPSTGGMGTKIFYLGGGAMVAVAGVFLITKKRMGKSEN